MRITIIGGTAFMGPCVLASLAARGHEVTVVHRGKTPATLPHGAREILADRRKLQEHARVLREAKPEVVIDMVLLSEADARGLYEVYAGVARRVIAVSSVDLYRAFGVLTGIEPGSPQVEPIREDSPLRSVLFPYRGKVPGMDDYDKVKVEHEAMSHPDLPATVLRLPMVYGPRDRQHRMFPYLRRMDAGRKAIVLEKGMGAWVGCRAYVENVADAIVLAALDDRASGRIYNVADPVDRDEKTWIESIGKAAGWKGKTVEVPGEALPESLRAGMNLAQQLVVDSSAIRRELGYRETVPFEEGVRMTVAWERANPPPGAKDAKAEFEEEDAVLSRAE